jgi:hypothetical protein
MLIILKSGVTKPGAPAKLAWRKIYVKYFVRTASPQMTKSSGSKEIVRDLLHLWIRLRQELNFLISELSMIKLRIQSATPHQVFMSALLNDRASINHEYRIRFLNGS